MVWAGICYGLRKQVHFIDGILNAQRYCDEILRPIVEPFILEHHLMPQHGNAWPHVARICTQFLEAEKKPSSCMASILTVHVTHWACLVCSGSAYTTACSCSWQYPGTSHSHWRGVDQHYTGHNQQPDQLCEGDVLHCVRQTVVTPDTDCPPPLTCHTCEVDGYLGKGEVLTNTDLDRFVNNIWEK